MFTVAGTILSSVSIISAHGFISSILIGNTKSAMPLTPSAPRRD